MSGIVGKFMDELEIFEDKGHISIQESMYYKRGRRTHSCIIKFTLNMFRKMDSMDFTLNAECGKNVSSVSGILDKGKGDIVIETFGERGKEGEGRYKVDGDKFIEFVRYVLTKLERRKHGLWKMVEDVYLYLSYVVGGF